MLTYKHDHEKHNTVGQKNWTKNHYSFDETKNIVSNLYSRINYNRPFYRYGGHIELIRCPGGMSTFRLYFPSLFGTSFLKVFLDKIVMGEQILGQCFDVIMIAFFPRNIQ